MGGEKERKYDKNMTKEEKWKVKGKITQHGWKTQKGSVRSKHRYNMGAENKSFEEWGGGMVSKTKYVQAPADMFISVPVDINFYGVK
jgi:hypothetical protein